MPLTPRQVVDRLIDGVCRRIRERVPWRPGARELLSELADLSVPCALVTSSWRPVVDALLESIPHGAFQVVVTGDQVSHGKPHPEPYLTAAAALGVPVNDCVALEDSLTGMTAAVASGAKTIVIPNVVPLTPHKDAFLVPSLHGVNAADLVTLTRSRTGASAPHG